MGVAKRTGFQMDLTLSRLKKCEIPIMNKDIWFKTKGKVTQSSVASTR